MHTVITPNRRELIGKDDAESIQNAINLAKQTGADSVTIPRLNARTGKPLWSIGRAIILPSHLELILDNCHLRQQDGCFDNLFRSFEDPELEGHTLAEQKRGIRIQGRGTAVLDGGLHNGLTQKNSLQDGLPHITRNNLILLYNVRDFVIDGISLINQRHWAINLVHAERGRLSNLFFDGECDCRNQDGIDLRIGCSDILIENVTGQTGDDVIALSAIGNSDLKTTLNYLYRVEGHNEDIHDVIIRNVLASSVECAVIGIRCCDGRRIYNVSIDTVHCTDNYAEQDGKTYPEYPAFKLFKPEFSSLHRIYRGNLPYALIRIGQHGYFGKRNALPGEVCHIHATNLHMHKGSVIVANVTLEDCYFGNIYAGNDVDHILTTQDDRITAPKGAQMRNVVLENIFYRNQSNAFATAFEFDTSEENRHYRLEDLWIRNAFLGNCKRPFQISCEGEVRYQNLFGAHVSAPDGVARKSSEPIE